MITETFFLMEEKHSYNVFFFQDHCSRNRRAADRVTTVIPVVLAHAAELWPVGGVGGTVSGV
jgi:hypothetical protein